MPRFGDVFRALEVTLFLEPAEEETGTCVRVAHRKVWGDPWTEKSEYKSGEGATGWVFKTGITVQIVDLAHYEEEQAWIESQYPGLNWGDSLNIRQRAKEYFKIKDSGPSPPLSWLCAPIRGGDRILGVIRCAGATQNPFYFDKWQTRLLEGVGIRIGAWWQHVLRSRRREQEIHSWAKLIQGFDRMNRFVQRSLKQSAWDENGFFIEAMKLAHEAIPMTDNSDVRLMKVEENVLAPAAVCGSDWHQVPNWKKTLYTINPPGSTASYLIAERKGVLVYDDAKQAPYFKPTFSHTRKLILAPIESGKDVYGVLCIRSKSTTPFPANAKLIAGLLGQQLGLYHSLTLQIQNLQEQFLSFVSIKFDTLIYLAYLHLQLHKEQKKLA